MECCDWSQLWPELTRRLQM